MLVTLIVKIFLLIVLLKNKVAGIVKMVIAKRLKAYRPNKLSVCNISANHDQLYPHIFQGKPVKTFPLIKSDKAKELEKIKSDTKLLVKNCPARSVARPVKILKKRGIIITENGIRILKFSSNVKEYAIQKIPLK